MAELNCLNSEDELKSSLTENQDIDSSLNVDDLQSELGETSQISSILAIDSLDSEIGQIDATESKIGEDEQIESELDLPTVVKYKGKNTPDIVVNVDNYKHEISATISKIKYNSVFEFPSIGSDNLIYIDKSTKTMYMWDSDRLTYDRLASDWSDIEQINGGNA